MAESIKFNHKSVLLTSVQDDDRFQVRYRLDDCSELQHSIEREGLQVPLILWRERKSSSTYYIVEGHRRFTALCALGHKKVYAIIRDDLSEREALKLAYIQNAERKDLGPLDKARALQMLQEKHGLSSTEAQETIGFDKDTASRLRKLLKLPLEIQDALADEQITQSHALALEGYEGGDLSALISRIEKGHLSVRVLQKLVADSKEKPTAKVQARKGSRARATKKEEGKKPTSVFNKGKKGFTLEAYTFTQGECSREEHVQRIKDTVAALDRLDRAPLPASTGGRGGTQEWSGTSLNFQRGCENNCLYCYAKRDGARRGQADLEEWASPDNSQAGEDLLADDQPLPRLAEPSQINIVAGKKIQPYMFPSTHDITPANLENFIHVLRRALRGGNHVLVVSKPHLVCIKSICEAFSGYRNQVLFRFTIGSASDEVLQFWEPGAPRFKERLASLKHAHSHGFKTSVSCEPMLDDKIHAVVDAALPLISDALWIGTMNDLLLQGTGELRKDTQHLKKHFAKIKAIIAQQDPEHLRSLYERYEQEPKIKWKKEVKKVLELPLLNKPDKAWFTAEPPPVCV